MGVVYKAQDTHLDRPVALKFLPPHLGTDKDARARFIQEANSVSSLEHTSVCTIPDYDKHAPEMMYLKIYSLSWFRTICEDPRYAERLKRMNLEP